jgi:hypothetical protein
LSCFRNFNKIELSAPASDYYIVLENKNNIGLFFDQDSNVLSYDYFLNTFYAISVPKNTKEINSSVYFHPSWILIKSKNFSDIKYSLNKNELNSLRISLNPENNDTKIYLIFYPQLIFYILLIPTLGIYLYFFKKVLKNGITN